MRSSLTYIILLILLIFSPVKSQASPSAGLNEYQSSIHDILSCLDCHLYIKENPDHPSIEDSNASCLDCHDNESGFSHSKQHKVKCLNCHTRHNEKVSNDAHLNIPCELCHFKNITPVRKIKSNFPVWNFKPLTKEEYDPHILIKKNMCSRCHFNGNNLGVSDNTLPSKSIICMPCHAATFSIGDIPSAAAVIIFLIGILSIFFIWLSAGKSYRKEDEIKQISFKKIINSLILDGIFQGRLLKISLKRWIIHEMIFLSIVVRFFWGITALISSLFAPEWSVTWIMLDKNAPVTGLIFDITGLLIIMGGCFMFFRKMVDKKNSHIKGLPNNNILVYVLLAGMILSGFIIEGARIAMTGSPEGSQFAFIGFLISKVLMNYHLNGLYAYLWYMHAVITAVFIACLPFSRMFHVFTAPLSLLLRGVSKD